MKFLRSVPRATIRCYLFIEGFEMANDCEERLQKIVTDSGNAGMLFTAIGDETRQLILLVLLESDLSGIRVGEIARKSTSYKTLRFPSSANP